MKLTTPFIKRHWPKLTIVLWLLLQLPFLTADLPLSLSYSRGPYSDEGLNTYAVRNYINSEFESLPESDNFIKSPLLSGYLFPVFVLAKNDLTVGRMAMLALTALLFLMTLKHLKQGWLLVLAFAFLPSVFHFSRLMMGDLLSVFIPLVALLVFIHKIENQQKLSAFSIFGLTLFASMGLGMKIQSVALLGIFGLTVLLYLIWNRASFKHFLGLFFGVLPILFLYGLIILNQADLFEYIFNQIPEYYENEALSLSQVFDQNAELHLKSLQGKFLIGLWFLSGMLLLMLAAKYEWKKILYTSPFLFLTLYQFSGMYMVYFPPRYVLGLFVSSLVLLLVLLNYTSVFFPKMPQFLTGAFVVGLLSVGSLDYIRDYESRTFHLLNMNKTIARKGDAKVIIGSWAPSLTFCSKKALAYPVWESYLTFRKINNPIVNYNPDLIVAEPNEDDSAWAYKKIGVDLYAFPLEDTLSVGRFHLNIYSSKP